MSSFEPLVRIAGTAFPYWLIAVVLMSVLTGFMGRRSEKKPFLVSALSAAGIFCALSFIVLGIYVQLTRSPVSFANLLPSSLLVGLIFALLFSAAGLIFSRSEGEDEHLGMMVVAVVAFSLLMGIFLDSVVSIFPPFIAAHFV